LQNQEQLETLKSSLEDEINYHKEEIGEHEVCSSSNSDCELIKQEMIVAIGIIQVLLFQWSFQAA